MPFVDDADVQIHLPVDILKVEEVPDDLAKAKEDAERIVRGYLSGVVTSAVLATWTTPGTTPGEIRAITGRFAAALIYRLRFGGSATADPAYAQNKYVEAMGMLNAIIAGDIALTGDTTTFDNTWFEPNASTDDPKFTMSGRF